MDSSAAPTTGVSPVKPDIARMIRRYVQLRDRKEELVKLHKEQLKPYNALMDELGNKLLDHMQKTGVNSMSSKLGSVYQLTKLSATLRDGSVFRQWVVDNNEYGLVDWRANAPAVFEWIKENGGQTPPGLNVSTFTTVGVRRPNEKE